MAQQLEDGDATKSARDLRAAEQALREALQRGASDEEIRKLMQQLREAANRFMSEMARNSQPDSNPPEDQNLQAQDLNKLLDQMEDTARNGSREDAQAMLDQMQEMFENMRSGRDAQESPAEREMRKQIGELEKLLRDQQALRDDTFRSDQKDRVRKRAPRNQSAPEQDSQGQTCRGNRTRMARMHPTRATTIPTSRTNRARTRLIRANRRSRIASRSCATASPNCSASSRA